ncbi:GntR family transcriptional regulator [Microbacterium sp.]|uniref:GntR family transcriptional regulator n=1 Tax=Microbacterium sp. TaxID=51671 RepID=UPI003A922A12
MTQFDDAVVQIREQILSGALAPGRKLAAEEIAAALGMSRSPVREAFRVLASEGIVELTQNRGARVSAWSADEIEAVFEVRIRLEGLAAHRAAERITTQQIDELERVARQIRAVSDPVCGDHLAEVQRLNAEFHQGIMTIADSSSLASAVAGVVHASVLTRTRQSFGPVEQERSDEQHLEMVTAFRARDGVWAENVMRAHLLSARASLMGPRHEHV